MRTRLRNIGTAEVERVLRKAGFTVDRQKGSHKQYLKEVEGKAFRVTVAVNRKSYNTSTIKSMISQSGMTESEWEELL
ncbi:MAG: type II toxin-antitoxin system HicA family toxin [bacterium]